MVKCLWSAESPISPCINEVTEELDLSCILSCHHDLSTVFSKSNAGALPPTILLIC